MNRPDPEIVAAAATSLCGKIARELIADIFHPHPATSLAAAQTLQIVTVDSYSPMLRRQIAYRLSVLKHSEPDIETRQILAEIIDALASPHLSKRFPSTPSVN